MFTSKMAAKFRKFAPCFIVLLAYCFIASLLYFRLQWIHRKTVLDTAFTSDISTTRLQLLSKDSVYLPTEIADRDIYGRFTSITSDAAPSTNESRVSTQFTDLLLTSDAANSTAYIEKVLHVLEGMPALLTQTRQQDPKKVLTDAFVAAKDLRAKSVFDFISCSQKMMEDEGTLSPDFYDFTSLWGGGFAFECTSLEDMHFMKSLVVQRRPPWPITALASFPGSGNTWIRFLLEQTTGVFTGSNDCDMVLKRAGLLGESITSNNVLVIKTHHPSLFVEHLDPGFAGGPQYKAAIVLIRNPYDAILAEYQMQVLWSHVRTLEPSHFKENFTEWNRSCCRLNKQWVQFAEFWLGDDVHIRRTVVSFDQLLTNRTVVLRKVLEFLKLPVDENKLKCVSGMIAHHAKRRYPESGKFYPYSSDQLSLLRQSILSLQSLLVRHGVDSSSWLQLEDSLLENSSDGAGTPRT